MAATSRPALTVTILSDREIALTRVFDAPRSLVFEAWTRPEHVVRWFGPKSTTLPVCEIDLRPGGAYRYVMRGPDGEDFPMRGVYREIAPPERLVYTESYDLPGMGWTPESLVTMTLEERDGRTTMTSKVLYQSVELRDGHIQSGMEAGAAETLDRLAEHLGTMGRAASR